MERDFFRNEGVKRSVGQTDERKKSPSHVSEKELARTVQEKREVTFTTHTGDTLKGFVCGWDNFHWKIVDHKGFVHLVHKSAPLVTIGARQELKKEVEQVVAPFRSYLAQNRGQREHSGDGRGRHGRSGQRR